MTRAEILARIVPCLNAVSWVSVREPINEETRLDADLQLAGLGLLQVGELLEQEFEIAIRMEDLINVALGGATAGQLVSLVGEIRDDA